MWFSQLLLVSVEPLFTLSGRAFTWQQCVTIVLKIYYYLLLATHDQMLAIDFEDNLIYLECTISIIQWKTLWFRCRDTLAYHDDFRSRSRGWFGLLEIIYCHSDSITITRPLAYQRKFLSISVVLEFMQNDEKISIGCFHVGFM